MEQFKLWSEDRTRLRLAILQLEFWADQLSNEEAFAGIVQRLRDITLEMITIDANSKSLQVPPNQL